MPKVNGVTRGEFYEKFMEFTRDSNMQYRAIAEFMGRCDERGDALEKRLDIHRKELDTINSKVNVWGGGNTMLAVAAGVVAWLKGS